MSLGGELEINPARFLAEMQEACDAERDVTFAPALDAALGAV